MDESLARQKVVRAAMGFAGTPYAHMGRVKGVGVDCLTLLAEVYAEAGVVKAPIEIPYYPPDFMLHRAAERYLDGLMKYTRELVPAALPKPGDIALWRFGRCFSHSAIVINWPMVIHAYVDRVVTLENAEAAQWLMYVGEDGPDKGKIRPRRFFWFFAVWHG